MKCVSCGHSETRTEIGIHNYKESGLDNIVLHNVEKSFCPICGETEVSIPKIKQLHSIIAKTLASKGAKLNSKEIRFLRTHLGFSSNDFAEAMGVTITTVSRWENNKAPINNSSELLLRSMILKDFRPKLDYGKLMRIEQVDHSWKLTG